MLKVGEKQELIIEKQVSFGVYLKEENGTEHVLLPRAQVPEGARPGDKLTVFLYKDSEDRIIATVRTPRLTLGRIARLKVAATGRIGAFLEWGLDKDLLLPFREQPKVRVKEGDEVLAALYLDKSGRLCATMNVYPYLRTDSPYHTGDWVRGTVYETSRNFGTFVAVDDIYSALIPKKELVRQIPIGETVTARVTAVRPDGKLDLSIREKGYLQMEESMKAILKALEENGGRLMLCDRSSPEEIREKMQMSKNEFKRAVGHLYKEGRILLREDCIELKV